MRFGKRAKSRFLRAVHICAYGRAAAQKMEMDKT
jgi:hypothetical protein